MTFAGFEVLGRVAQGSTGIVWQARQVELDRIVAIKELSPMLLNAPGFLQRFRAEAQTLAALDDPHVVRIFDYVEEPGRAYLVEEWVDGANPCQRCCSSTDHSPASSPSESSAAG